MITQYEVHSLITDEIPRLGIKKYPSRVSFEIYTSMNKFTDYTMNTLKAHNYVEAKKCLALAEQLYINGDKVVRSLIENNFLYSFTSCTPNHQVNEIVMKCMLPKTLYPVYIKQLLQKNHLKFQLILPLK